MKKRKCPYCVAKRVYMELEYINEYCRIWKCPEEPLHEIPEWKCGLCGRWGSKDIIADYGSPTGFAHISCWERELIHWTCTCGLNELIPRGSGIGVYFRRKHRGEGHDLKVERTFKLGSKKIYTIMGREIEVE